MRNIRQASRAQADLPIVGKSIADKESGGPEDYDALLKKYVRGDYLDYAALKDSAEDMARFDAFMRWQAEANVSEMSREEAIAFYINAYNSCCIKAILDNYPVHTPNDIDGFFDKLTFKVGGEMLKIGGSDGDSIEYDRLIANYKDMRAHFAVVCADRGCLPLKAGAYDGDTLDEDLEAAAKKFVSDKRHFSVDKEKGEVQISKIFEWYGPKFLKDPERPTEGDQPELYLTHWVDEDVKEFLESGKYKLKIIEWDWTLNEQSSDDGAAASNSVTESKPGSAEDYDAILKEYVSGDYFDYAALKDNEEDLARFDAFLKWQAEADVKSMSREEAIAFYINAYNSCCIKAILDNYPVHSPNDIDGFFDKLTFKVGGEMLKIGGSDGDSIEYDRLIANYKDMRAHFAVVCADRGCLPLKAGAYKGETLDDDLEAAAKRFVNDERHFKVDRENGKVHISKIFEWYGTKFLEDPKRKIDGDRPEVYLTHWVDKDLKEMLESGKYKLKIIEWDWTINEGRYEK